MYVSCKTRSQVSSSLQWSTSWAIGYITLCCWITNLYLRKTLTTLDMYS